MTQDHTAEESARNAPGELGRAGHEAAGAITGMPDTGAGENPKARMITGRARSRVCWRLCQPSRRCLLLTMRTARYR